MIIIQEQDKKNPQTVEEWLGKDNKLGQDIFKKYTQDEEDFTQWLDRLTQGNENLARLITEKKVLFAGRTLANLNTNNDASVSNCYTYGRVGDSIPDIMQAAYDIALTFKSQGGQGLSLSNIRPQGCKIHGGYETDGIVPFMKIYNTVTEAIRQGGSRKGALLMSIDAWHKDAETFITIKNQQGMIEKANLSLEIDDEFMEYVEKDIANGTETKVNRTFKYNSGSITYEVIPVRLFRTMCQNAYDWGEPGVLFMNRLRDYNLMQYDSEYQIDSTNPCGEQPMNPGAACNLSSIILSSYVKNPYTDQAYFDYDSLTNDIPILVSAMNIVIDYGIDKHPLEIQKEMSKNYRNMGIGILGLASALIRLGIRYGSEKSVDFVDKIGFLLFKQVAICSVQEANRNGSFPKYSYPVFDSDIIRNHFSIQDIANFKKSGIRNCSLLSIAPTGSIGTMLDLSTGMEPFFALQYTRKTESLNGGVETYYQVDIPEVAEYKKINHTDVLPDYFVTSGQIGWQERINVQSALQQHVDTGISSTVNLPVTATVEDIEHLYCYAWRSGLKGITIFRNGCRRAGILTDTPKPAEEIQKVAFNKIVPVSRKKLGITNGKTYYKKTACGTFYMTLNRDKNNNIVESFVNTSKGGICPAHSNAVCRLISLCLRGGIKVEEIADQLMGINCPACARRKDLDGMSCPDIYGKTLLEFYNDKAIEQVTKIATESVEVIKESSTEKCPECGTPMAMSEGCVTCQNCGYSRCG